MFIQFLKYTPLPTTTLHLLPPPPAAATTAVTDSGNIATAAHLRQPPYPSPSSPPYPSPSSTSISSSPTSSSSPSSSSTTTPISSESGHLPLRRAGRPLAVPEGGDGGEGAPEAAPPPPPPNKIRNSAAPKIAFLFLTNSDLTFAPLWNLFFNHTDAHLFNIYVHSDPTVTIAPLHGFFRDRLIPSKRTQRSSPTLISAARQLLATAILDDPRNTYFALHLPALRPPPLLHLLLQHPFRHRRHQSRPPQLHRDGCGG